MAVLKTLTYHILSDEELQRRLAAARKEGVDAGLKSFDYQRLERCQQELEEVKGHLDDAWKDIKPYREQRAEIERLRDEICRLKYRPTPEALEIAVCEAQRRGVEVGLAYQRGEVNRLALANGELAAQRDRLQGWKNVAERNNAALDETKHKLTMAERDRDVVVATGDRLRALLWEAGDMLLRRQMDRYWHLIHRIEAEVGELGQAVDECGLSRDQVSSGGCATLE